MFKDLELFIIQEIKDYKENREILVQLSLEEENVSISASLISDMPRSITNKFYSIIIV